MKILLLLLILLLPLSSLADPTFRSTDSNKGSPSSVSSSPTEFHLLQGGRVLKERDEIGNYLNLERRIEMEESTDYPGTGANSHHDPKTPGRP